MWSLISFSACWRCWRLRQAVSPFQLNPTLIPQDEFWSKAATFSHTQAHVCPLSLSCIMMDHCFKLLSKNNSISHLSIYFTKTAKKLITRLMLVHCSAWACLWGACQGTKIHIYIEGCHAAPQQGLPWKFLQLFVAAQVTKQWPSTKVDRTGVLSSPERLCRGLIQTFVI